MNAVPFDTLRMAQRREAAGFSGPQAAGAAEALAEALVGADLATKSDLATLRGDMKNDNELLRNEVKAENITTRHEMALLRRDMEVMRRDITIKLGGMIVVGVGLSLGAMRYMTLRPWFRN
jgi:hypothetical protein